MPTRRHPRVMAGLETARAVAKSTRAECLELAVGGGLDSFGPARGTRAAQDGMMRKAAKFTKG